MSVVLVGIYIVFLTIWLLVVTVGLAQEIQVWRQLRREERAECAASCHSTAMKESERQ